MGMDPREPAVAVLDWAGVGRLRRKPILDRDTDDAEQLAPAVESRVLHGVAAEHEASAVHPVQTAARLGDLLRSVDA